MKAPIIYVGMRRGEFTQDPVAWSFDEDEAATEAVRLHECSPIGGECNEGKYRRVW